jgi:hypothetical protein
MLPFSTVPVTDSYLSLSPMLRPTVSRPVCLGINHKSGAYDQIFITCVTVTVLFLWAALSDGRTSLSFAIATGPRQRSHFRVRVPLDTWPYFTLSDSRLPFSSPPTTRRVTVDVFDHVKVKVMLRPTVSRPVCLGIKHPFVAYDQILIIAWQLRVCWFGATSLTRGRVCRLQLLLVHASAIIFETESRRTRGHILLSRLKFESYCPVHVGRPLSREIGSVFCQSWSVVKLFTILLLKPNRKYNI